MKPIKLTVKQISRNSFQPGLVVSLFFFTLFASVLGAASYPEPTGYVNDFAKVLDPNTFRQLTVLTKDLETKTSAELAVVTIGSVAPVPLKDYAVGLFNHWKVGKKNKDNGVLLIVAIQDRRVEIEVGYGLEPILTDGRCGEILDRYVVPHFKNNHWSQGILEGAQAITKLISENPASIAENSSTGRIRRPSFRILHSINPIDPSFSPFSFFLVVGCLIFGVAIIRNIFRWPQCPKCNRRKFVRRRGSVAIIRATYANPGLKEVTYYCKACKYEWMRRERIPQLSYSSSSSSWSGGSSFGGSSFGGFGGGCSGGGGAGRSF